MSLTLLFLYEKTKFQFVPLFDLSCVFLSFVAVEVLFGFFFLEFGMNSGYVGKNCNDPVSLTGWLNFSH